MVEIINTVYYTMISYILRRISSKLRFLQEKKDEISKMEQGLNHKRLESVIIME